MSKQIVCDGNEAAAWGVSRSRPDMVSVYPITPQSSLAENISSMVADGSIDADLMDVEGEHSVLSVLHGASLSGARTFTASCGQGLAFMFEPYFRTPPMRLPIVMSIVTRDGITPQCVWGGQQDAMTLREVGWIQMYTENNQEILDTVIMAYKIAENPDVMIPTNVCHDGNYQGYGIEPVEVPDQDLVDNFLGSKDINWHVALDPEKPMGVDPLTGGTSAPSFFVRYRKGLCQGLQNSLQVITDVHKEWAHVTGREWAPLVEEYRLDDAEYAIITIGGMTGAGKDAVDAARDTGEKVGLIKVKTFRPYPQQALLQAISKVKAIGVVDRSVSFSMNCGPLYQDILTTLYYLKDRIPAISFIGGLAGADITENDFHNVIEMTSKALHGGLSNQTIWLNE